MTLKAIAILRSDDLKLHGTIEFEQTGDDAPTAIKGRLTGLADGLHGFHVHEWGDTTNGCVSAGQHFNPFGKKHGAPDADERHVGDLGNVKVIDGVATVDISDSQIKLCGKHSAVGRTLVVHAQEDDLGLAANAESVKTGNAGSRIACGVIGIIH
ncbi:superoxide dismutase [Cu-Zn] [Ramicandelaber brevisporus]|nr:superoxide dismutase [Cu-Zn] [Ramicandelaber brevisporus]